MRKLMYILMACFMAFGILSCSDSGSDEPNIVATPTASPPSSQVDYNAPVELSTATDGADIYFTRDGSDPTRSNSTLYVSPILITDDVTIKAFAVLDGWVDSGILTADYTISPDDIVNTPYALPENTTITLDKTITLHTNTDDAIIYYTTDGAPPTRDSERYIVDSPIAITEDTTIRAIAVKDNMKDSEVFSARYVIEQAATPVLDGFTGAGPHEINFEKYIKFLAVEEGTTIYYNIINDEESALPDPDNKSTPYDPETGIEITYDVGTTVRIKAIAINAFMKDSAVLLAEFRVVAAGILIMNAPDPEAGPVTIGTDIVLSTATIADASFYYTYNSTLGGDENLFVSANIDDAGDPIEQWVKFNTSIKINDDTTFWAVAVRNGYTRSRIAGPFIYTIDQVAPLRADPETGSEVLIGDTIELSTPTQVADTEEHKVKIYFTYDDSEFTEGNTNNWVEYSEEPENENMPIITEENLRENNVVILRAIAVRDDMRNSAPITATYTIRQAEAPNVSGYTGEEPYQITYGTYVMFNELTGVDIYYNIDGSTNPSDINIRYTANGIQIIGESGATVIINAIAKQENMLDSEVISVRFTIIEFNTLLPPRADPESGRVNINAQVELITDEASNPDIYYTYNSILGGDEDSFVTDNISDAGDPKEKWVKYAGALATITISEDTTIYAIATQVGYLNSSIAGPFTYTIARVEAPTATPTAEFGSRQVESTTPIVLVKTIEEAIIYYTTDASIGSNIADNTNWTTENLYTEEINIAADTTIWAIAVYAGIMLPSDVLIAEYTLAAPNTVARPYALIETQLGITPTATIARGTAIRLETSTAGAEIRYTLNGDIPGATSTLYDSTTGINTAEIAEDIFMLNAIAIDTSTDDPLNNSSILIIDFTITDTE